MGPNKKGFNWKARQVVTTKIIQTEGVEIEISGTQSSKYDECNALVLPSKKRKTKVVKEKKSSQRILSKTQRKKLEKIVDVKKKKANRADLLESLAKLQPSAQEFSMMTSLTSVQTKGIKRSMAEVDSVQLFDETGVKNQSSGTAGSKRRQRWKEKEDQEKVENPRTDGNVIGIEVIEESSSSENEEMEEEEDENTEEPDENIEESEENKEEPEGSKETPRKEDKEDKEDVSEETISKAGKADISNGNIIATEECTLVEKDGKTPAPKREAKPAIFVPVHRTAEVQAARMKLPILAEEQAIVEAINENPVVILAGETGSGKTTQVPQFLYEAGYAANGKIIGVTEPRRVAATSMANRVADEMNLHDGQVGYQIRFEGNVKDNTRIKFMTDGVLLKEVQKDFLLSNYSVVIIDEAHERSVYSDILLGLLSRIVMLRHKRGNPLKMVIMSATLRVEDFTENRRLFKNKPVVIQVEARQFPVSVHFNKRTAFEDYVDEAYRKVCKIHRQLPDGGILVFLTGQQEVNALCRKLRQTFPGVKKVEKPDPADASSAQPEDVPIASDPEEDEDMEKVLAKIKRKQQSMKKRSKKEVDQRIKINLDHYSALPLQEQEQDHDENLGDLADSDQELDINDEQSEALSQSQTAPPLWVLPLYSLLPSNRQQKVFAPPPEGSRLCVVSTNVAETSLTIPNVRYVVDTGRVKTKFFDKITGVSAFHVTWTSQAAANQRAGRAGRTGPGHCYRLYSSAVFNDEFEKFSLPDIARRPIDDLVLQMKSMDIEKVIHFPFPTPPDIQQLYAAERRLLLLNALEPPPRSIGLKQSQEWTSKITPLGRAMAAYPLAPRYAKMLLLSQQNDLLQLSITLVAALSVQELVLDQPADSEAGDTHRRWLGQRRSWAGTGQSLLLGDPMVLLRAVGAAEYSGDIEAFCSTNGIRSKALREVRKLRVQLTNETNLILPSGTASIVVDPRMAPPTELQAKLLRQILMAGLPDHVAKRIPPNEIKEAEDRRKYKYAYRCPEMEDPVFLNPSSILRYSHPEWIVYQDIYEHADKIYLRGITAIEPEWLPIFSPTQCTFSAPLELPTPRYDSDQGRVMCHMNVTFGRSGWPLPVMELEYPAGIDRFKFFAQFFLNGDVCRPLAKYTASLLSTPSTMVKTWAKLQPRTQMLLQQLTISNVDSLDLLLAAWQKDKFYLLEVYKAWVPESLHEEISTLWPPV